MKAACTLVTGLAVALLSVASLRAQTVTGSGTPGTIPVWTGTTKLGNSQIFETGSQVGIGSILTGYNFTVDSKGSAILGFSSGNVGVTGKSSTSIGTRGVSASNAGVSGVSTTGFGVTGESSTYRGVEGISDGSKGGVVGISTRGDGIGGVACNGCGSAAVIGLASYAGDFEGDVEVRKNLMVSGIKAFHIDHPLDPANKYLNHASIESSEVLDMYSGNITTDLSGMATVAMPDYFSVLNGDCRYQLTVVGQFAQAIVAREIENNTFVIKTDKPSVKVSWQVTGVRQDAWVKRHPLKVEEDKPRKERGYYLHPELFGQPEEKGVVWLYHEDLMRDAKVLWSRQNANSK